MNTERPSRSAVKTLAVAGSVLAVAGVVWLIVLLFQGALRPTQVGQADRLEPLLPVPTASVAAAPPVPTAAPEQIETQQTPTPSAATPVPEAAVRPLTPRLLLDSDLGTGSTEFSAVALNEDLNRILIADDADVLFEFELDDDGLPITPLRRTIKVAVGAGDVEGLAWLGGQTYVIAHEDDGALTIIDLDDETQTITTEHLVRSIATTIPEENGSGLEGVSAVPSDGAIEFVVVDERPPTMLALAPDGSIAFTIDEDFAVTDFSDIYVSPAGVYSILSDESRVIVDFVLDGSGQPVEQGRIELDMRAGRFEQPEGLVRSRDGSRLYVVGESPGSGQFAFGLWSNR